MRKRILFVDDDPTLVRALRGLLHRERERWEIGFALGSDAALLELGRSTYDMVVSDSWMPGMHGEDLLARVRATSPATLLVLLTGSDCEMPPFVDELLHKPCEGRELRRAIERLFESHADPPPDARRTNARGAKIETLAPDSTS